MPPSDNYDDLPEDERPLGVEEAKKRVAAMLDDPKYRRPKGHKDVERTRDDDMKGHGPWKGEK